MESNPAQHRAPDPTVGPPVGGCACECTCGTAGPVDTLTVGDAPVSRAAADLRSLRGVLGGRDRAMARAARLVVRLRGSDSLHDTLGGMSLQVWLEHVARLRGTDARALLGAVEVLERMPLLLAGLWDGWVSWSQVAAICRAARRVRVAQLPELDELVAGAMVGLADCEPDAIVADLWQWIDARQPTRLEREEAAAERTEFVSLMPRLFGGGKIFGELGTVNFATVADALSGPVAPPTAPAIDVDGLDGRDVDGLFDSLDERRRAHTRDHGAAMAARLVDLCALDLAAGDPPRGDQAGTRRARPLLLATVDLDALLDQARTPGWLLHTLAGGHMKITSAALQRLVDERGADLRTIVLDDTGQAVGVGQRTHVPPGWLREAIWARDLAVRDPDGSTPIRRADLDHVTPWPAGPTDADNLQPVGRRWHNLKTSKAWTVAVGADGTTTWTHRRHGWTIRLAPARRDLERPRATGPPRPPPIQGAWPRNPTQPELTGMP